MAGTPNTIDHEPKPSVITPKIEPMPYYPGPVGSTPHVIKEMKPTVCIKYHLDDLARFI